MATDTHDTHDAHETETRSTQNRRGLVVLVVLATLTLAEFVAAVSLDDALQFIALGISALLKALLIAHYFMHWRQIFGHIGDIAAGDAEVVED